MIRDYGKGADSLKVNLVVAAREFQWDERTNDLNIIGVFTEAKPSALPGILPLMSIIMFCEAEVTEFGKKKFIEIELRTADGKLVQAWHDTLVVPEAQRAGERSFPTPIYPLADIPFAKPGNYGFYVAVDGDPKNTLPFYVHPPTETSEPERGET